MEYTFAMIRPGAMRRHKVAHIFDQIKQSGLKIEYFEQKYLNKEFIEEHYSHLHDPSIPPDVFERTEKENLSGWVKVRLSKGSLFISFTLSFLLTEFIMVCSLFFFALNQL